MTTTATRNTTNTAFATHVLASPPVVTLTAYIPSAAVGAVIGRRGQNVEDLQRKAAQAAVTRQPVRVSVVGHESVAASLNNSNHNNNNTSSSGGGTGVVAVTTSATSVTTEGPSTLNTKTTGNHNTNTAATNNNNNNNNNNNTATTINNNTTTALPYTYSGLDFSDPAWTPVVVRADVPAALCAGRGLAQACRTLDGVVLDVPLPRHRHAAVIGKHGQTIAKLSAEHGVRIMVPHRAARHDVVQLEGGTLEAVQACLADLLNTVSRVPRTEEAAGSNNSNNNNNTTANNNTTETVTLTVPPSQTRLRNLARKTDCSLKKKKVVHDTEQWQIVVTGKAPAVAAAVAALRKWRETDDSTGSGGGGAGSTGSPTKSSSNKNNNNNNNATNSGKKKPRWKRKNSNASHKSATGTPSATSETKEGGGTTTTT